MPRFSSLTAWGDWLLPARVSQIHFIGGEKGGVGKSVMARLLAQYWIDHNRPFAQLSNYTRGTRKARTTGAFAHLGEEIPADELEENLVRHLRRWAPYIGRFGLLVLELHTLPPEVAATTTTAIIAPALIRATPARTCWAVRTLADLPGLSGPACAAARVPAASAAIAGAVVSASPATIAAQNRIPPLMLFF